jgi:hypothetical protein
MEDEDGLPGEALVVRGGIMLSRDLRRNAEFSSKIIGIWAVSVWAYPDMTVEEIVRKARLVLEGALPQGQLCSCSAGGIRDAGLRLVATEDEGHYSLVVPENPDEAVWQNLRHIFGPPFPNPVARRERNS